MSRPPVLVFEPDPALRALLVASLQQLELSVIAADEDEISEQLQSQPAFSGVLLSSAIRSRFDLEELRQSRPADERWLIMASPEDSVELAQQPLDVLVQPFRACDLQAALTGTQGAPEDALLFFDQIFNKFNVRIQNTKIRLGTKFKSIIMIFRKTERSRIINYMN